MKRFSIIQEILSGPRSSLNLTWIYESFCSRFSFQVVLYNDFIIVRGQKKKRPNYIQIKIKSNRGKFTHSKNTCVNNYMFQRLAWIMIKKRYINREYEHHF